MLSRVSLSSRSPVIPSAVSLPANSAAMSFCVGLTVMTVESPLLVISIDSAFSAIIFVMLEVSYHTFAPLSDVVVYFPSALST